MLQQVFPQKVMNTSETEMSELWTVYQHGSNTLGES